MVGRTRQHVNPAISFQHFSQVISDRIRQSPLDIGVVVRRIGGQHHGAPACIQPHHLQSHGVPAEMVHAESRGEFLVAIVKHNPSAVETPHHGNHVVFLEWKSHERMSHVTAGGELHFAILHVVPGRGKHRMVSAVVVVHVRDDDVFNLRCIDSDLLQAFGGAVQQFTPAFLRRHFVEPGIDNERPRVGNRRPDEVVHRHGRFIMWIAAHEVFARGAHVLRVTDRINFPNVGGHGAGDSSTSYTALRIWNETMKKFQMLIDGAWVDPVSRDWFESINPFTAAPWALIPRGAKADVDRAVGAARKAFDRGSDWRRLTASARGALLVRLADLVAGEADRLAEIETTDNGKLLAEMRGQLNYIPQWFRYFGGLADKIEGRVLPIDKPGVFNFTREEPLGVVAAIVPWNSPLMLATWKLAPALAAGNTVVWKPSEHSSVSALEFGDLFEKAGFPPGVVNIITGFGSDVGEPLVAHPDVAKIAFTGGDRTGENIYQLAARGLKRTTLELGGKSANIVFDDANLDQAVNGVISGIFAATGQTCIAGSRALIHRPIMDAFVERLLAMAATARMGNPLDLATQVGPITTRPQYERVLDYVRIAKEEGAVCRLGGAPATRPECGTGWFVEPTVFTGVRPDMRIANEEVFGPLLSIIPFDDEEEAIRIANNTVYGLAAGVWTGSIRRALTMSERLEAGTVWVNCYRVNSYMSPFGGFKRSGIGREGGAESIREYLQTKSVWIDIEGNAPNPFIQR